MKKCRCCGEEKQINDYYTHPRMRDGHLNFCKACVKNRVSAHWYQNADVLREKEKIRNKKRLANPEYVKKRLEYSREFRKGGIGAAHNKVARHLSNERPGSCPICGAKKRIVAHHEDYGKPLEVTWCCYPCHSQIHLGKGAR